MWGIVKSELVKTRHSFVMKSVLAAPLITVLLGMLLGASFAQLSAYNWWYTVILPVIVSIWAAGSVVREKKTGMQNIACLPIRADRLWMGKNLALAVLLFAANLLLWLFTTAAGFLTETAVSPLDGLAGCMLLFLTYLWQLPLVLLLTRLLGYIPAVLISSAANVLLSIACSEKSWFMFVPYAIPARVVYPFFKMRHNGLSLEAGSPLLSADYVFPAVVFSLLLALLILLCGAGLLRKGGWGHD